MTYTHRIGMFAALFFTIFTFDANALDQQTRRPNVVVFLVDDLGPDELVCYASKFHETPNIDALAARGMRFTCAYSGSTLCSPSRAALLTGRSPARLHLTDWIPGQEQINRKTVTPAWQTWIDRKRVLLPGEGKGVRTHCLAISLVFLLGGALIRDSVAEQAMLSTSRFQTGTLA